jgi:hypothetical protein
MQTVAGRLVVQVDLPDNYYLVAPRLDDRGREVYFGAVQIKKNYVSYHLMPVYIYPELLSGTSANLMRRMQGKSCFNFKAVDEALFTELAELTQRCVERYADAGLA